MLLLFTFSVCFHFCVHLFVWLLSSFLFSLLCVCVCVRVCVCVCVCFLLCVCLFSIFFPFLLHHMACGVMVLWTGVRPEPLRWESRVQEIGLPKNSQPRGILIGKSSPRGLHLNTKTWLPPVASKDHERLLQATICQ